MNALSRLLGRGIPIALLIGAVDIAAVTVCPVGCDFPRIRNAVSSGATLIEVFPGTYPATVQLNGQALVGLGTDPADVVIVGDCLFPDLRVLRIGNDPTPSVIRNLTVAQPVGCNFDNGISVGGDVSIENVVVGGFPRVGTNGGGIVVSNINAQVLVSGSRLFDNGIGINGASSLEVYFSDISNNRNIGINLFGSPFNFNKAIVGTRIADNANHGLHAVVPVRIEDSATIGNTSVGLFNAEGSFPTIIGGEIRFNNTGVICADDRGAIIEGTVFSNNGTNGCVSSCSNGQTRPCNTGFVGIAGTQTCSSPGYWGQCNANPACADRELPAACGDGIDNDCDTRIDADDADCKSPGPPTNGGAPASGKSGDPINTYTGELYRQLPPDVDLGGPLRLHFSRYYASGLEALGRSGSLGTNWRHNFEWQVVDGGATVSLIDPLGRRIGFTLDGNDWQLDDGIDVPYQLVEPAAGQFILGDPRNGYSYHFANARLERINHGTSVSLTLSYSGGMLSSVADGLGRELSFSYDGALLASVSDGTRTVSFDQLGSLLSLVIDVRGMQTSYSYDGAAGRLLSWTRPEGNVPFVQDYDGSGRVITQTNASGNSWSLAYGADSTTISDPLGNTMTHTHSARGELIEVVDEAGDAFQIGYQQHRRDAIFDRRGGTTLIEHHQPSGRPSRIVGADGSQAQLYYAPRLREGLRYWNLAKARFPDGEEESYQWGAQAPTLRIDRAGGAWSTVYDGRGLPIARTNPKGGSSAAVYQADGTIASYTDVAGNSTSFSHDALRRLSSLTHADGSTRSYSWNAANQPLSLTDERGNTRSWSYDDNGNLAGYSDALANLSSFGYDNDDRLVTASDPLGNTLTLGYDPLGRLATVDDGSGRVSSFGYDARGRLSTITEPGGASWQSSFDAEGIIASITDPLGHSTSFVADAMGRLSSRTSPLGHVSSASHDSLGRLVSYTAADGQLSSYAYDARGLLTEIDYQGVTLGFDYDELGARTAMIDSAGQIWPFARDTMGRLTAVGDPLGRNSDLSYDNRNRVAMVSYPGGLGTLAIGYDPSGNPVERDYSDGTLIQLSWDARQLPVSGSGFSFGFDAAGRLIDSNGLAIVRDAAGRILSIDYDSGPGSKLLVHGYDARGLLANLTDWLGGITSFSYDAAGRLSTITRPNGVHSSYSWDDDDRLVGIDHGTLVDIDLTLDSVGRTLAATRTAPLLPAMLPDPGAFSFDAAGQISSPGYSYDALGRQTAGNGLTLDWDLASRLTSVVGGATVSYDYDAFGQPIARSSGGQSQQYIWNYALPLAMIAITRDGATDLRYDVHGPGGMLLYSLDASSGERRDHHHDELGHTLMLTDATGNAVASYAYGPYGELLASTGETGNPYTWLGQWGVLRDPANGLYSIRARWYSSSDRRFLSRDPQPARHPLASSPYQYGYGDPLRYVDVDGREPEKALERLLERHGSLRVVINRLGALKDWLRSVQGSVTAADEDYHSSLALALALAEAIDDITQEYAFELAYLDINLGGFEAETPRLYLDGIVDLIGSGLANITQVLDLARQAINAPPSPAPKPAAPASPPEEKPSGMDAFLDEVDRERGERDQSEGDLEWNVRERDYVTLPNGDRHYLPDEVYDPDGPASIYNLPPWQVVAPLMLQESVREKSQLRPAQGGKD